MLHSDLARILILAHRGGGHRLHAGGAALNFLHVLDHARAGHLGRALNAILFSNFDLGVLLEHHLSGLSLFLLDLLV